MVKALGGLGDRRVFESLVGRLDDDSGEVRREAVRALGWLGDPRSYEPLVGLLGDERFDIRREAVKALAELGDPRAFEPLVGLLSDARSGVRREALDALAGMGESGAFESLVGLLGDARVEVRTEVVRALGAMGDPRAYEPLVGLLGDASSEVRWEVARALAALGDPRAFEPLMGPARRCEWRRSPEDGAGSRVLADPRGYGLLVGLLSGESDDIRREAVRALGALADPRAYDSFVALLDDGRADIRREAVRALGGLGDARAFASLVNLLEDDGDDGVRASAARALGELGSLGKSYEPERLEALVAALDDPCWCTGSAAAEVLGGSGDPSAFEPLAAALAADGPDDDQSIWESVTEALGALGDRRAVAVLLDLLGDDSWRRRRAAMDALAELEAFRDESVRETVARRFAASTLLPAVSAVDEYHRGMLFCVQSIAERSAHGMRLELLQAVWRWRDLGASMGAEELSEDVGELRARLGEHAELGPYTLLLVAIVAGNDKRHAQSRAWAERGLAQANEHEVAVRVALTVVWAEALVGFGEAQEALKVLEALESVLPGHSVLPHRGRPLDFVPEAEVLMTKAFVLSKLGRHGEAIEAGEAAEWRLRSGRVWGRIDEERFTRLMGARVAPLLQHSHEAESRRYGRRSTRYFATIRRGVFRRSTGMR